MLVTKKDKPPIKKQAGNIQITKVKTARGTLPRLKPISVSVCVEEAPGKSWQNEIYSISSSLVTSFLLSTKVFIIMPIWPCGPPKAVILCKKTAFKKGMCRKSFNSAFYFFNPISLRGSTKYSPAVWSGYNLGCLISIQLSKHLMLILPLG